MTTATPNHEALAAARVLLVGLGGLGTPAAAALASAGVGRLGLIDPDVVELSNLHRQPLYESGDVGQPKVDVAAARLRAHAGRLAVETWRMRFGAEHSALAARFDLVLDGTDTIAAKFAVNDAALAAGVPLVHAGVLGFQAQLLTVLPGRSTCYRCIFEDPPPPGDVPSCQEAGVIGPLTALAGTLQAIEAVRLLTGSQAAFADRLLTIDARSGRWRTVPLVQNPRCPACANWRAREVTRRSVVA
jgi:molybdopterin/thiamine biosynthesis adenylyltransferase